MQLEILTPDKILFEGEADSVKFPGKDGKFQTLNMHAPMIAALDKGKIVIKHQNTTKEIEINGGMVEVLKNKVVVLV